DPVAQNRRPGPNTAAMIGRPANADSLPEQAVIANHRMLMHHDSALMRDAKTPAENRGIVDFDTVEIPHQDVQDRIEKAERRAKNPPTDTAAPHAKTVDRHRLEAGAGPALVIHRPVLPDMGDQFPQVFDSRLVHDSNEITLRPRPRER